MNISFEDSDDDELEVVIDGYEGHESFNNVEEMVDDEGSEPEGGENSHHDFDRQRRGRDPRVEEDSQTDDAVTFTALGVLLYSYKVLYRTQKLLFSYIGGPFRPKPPIF